RASFDNVGDIAIVEIARGLARKEKRLAAILLASQPAIKVVAKKVGGHTGRFRHQPLKVLAGERRLETEHRESGVRLRLNVQTCYFSPRMGTERLRIARLVKPGERVLVLFSGIGPFALIIAKNARPSHVDAVELNPAAHAYALQNVALNKLQSIVTPIKKDAKRFLASTKTTYDRVLLAWPGKAAPFIPGALRVLKKGGTLHFYDFAHEDAFAAAAQTVKDACAKAKRTCSIKRVVACGQYKPHVNRVCVDALVR
ncbi:MAG: hypothetical protein AABY13_01120, partial [Nanoarchaeota archaeon]